MLILNTLATYVFLPNFVHQDYKGKLNTDSIKTMEKEKYILTMKSS